ncbi:hypothetical protein FBY31_3347 [Arthrobacter sp. SLBN-100]|uniref:DUF6286 domain-containing protein n=1 Tax=Arthrobacter sp. SLBN-100 TaxID=2768450 RepID=UPI00114FAA6A|nr:DUF6286 domain-containing protein [Arthrobacter sp. SLBN-100]TQJ69216.1 hypothetical protein FBY31_3347 [Arthrobacter sp. SLBN-100]
MSRHQEDQSPDMGRVLRRETHSSRAVAATAAAVLVIVFAAYGLLEAGVHAIGQPAWLIEPQVAAERLVALPAGIPPLLLGAIGAVLAMFGLVFFLNGILPGRRARHLLAGGPNPDGPAVVVDDEVIASSLARRARLAANVTPEQVMVVVSQRQVAVNVRPTSGVPVKGDAVLAAVESELAAMALDPPPEVHVNVAPSGVIGA